MGHRFSKSSPTITTTKATHNTSNNVINGVNGTYLDFYGFTDEQQRLSEQSQGIAVPGPTINLHIAESPTDALLLSQSNCSSLSSVNTATSSNTCPRRIIIKIQLAKMENGNVSASQRPKHIAQDMHALDDANSNQILNVVTLNRNYTDRTEKDTRTAGSSRTNNNGCSNASRLKALQLSEEEEQLTHTDADESAEYCEVMVADSAIPGEIQALCAQTNVAERNGNASKVTSGPRRAKTKTSLSSSVGVVASTSKRRMCRDAFRRILDPSSTKLCKNKEYKEKRSISNGFANSSSAALTTAAPLLQQLSNINSTGSSNNSTPNTNVTTPTPPTGLATSNANKVSIWAPGSSNADVIIPFVVVQCPHSSLVTVGPFDESNGSGLRLMTTDMVRTDLDASALLHAATTAAAVSVNNSAFVRASTPRTVSTLVRPSASTFNAPIVHSQVDFVHCLVPDLERIANSSFYWGKMDRYEAERLLDGKPEGTFLLRDSAQEEFLFSVTFRKYGRSLHARIEQSGHKFSFDCHDPCVFTAPTVTGLLEHYKDPACVMFFEPMLTIPLHRKTTFSLQQLCRANIVSHTTYDGITDLELPVRLKSYLREYHYKQKLRVKPFDEPFYVCT